MIIKQGVEFQKNRSAVVPMRIRVSLMLLIQVIDAEVLKNAGGGSAIVAGKRFGTEAGAINIIAMEAGVGTRLMENKLDAVKGRIHLHKRKSINLKLRIKRSRRNAGIAKF